MGMHHIKKVAYESRRRILLSDYFLLPITMEHMQEGMEMELDESAFVKAIHARLSQMGADVEGAAMDQIA